MLIQQKISKMYFERDINGMKELENELMSKKMSRYKEFSVFLDGVQYGELNHEDLDTPLWDTYRKMDREFQEVLASLALCTYYKGLLYVQ